MKKDILNPKIKELQLAMKKQFKDTGGITLLETDESIPIEVIPTNIYSLDQATGIGGIPRGRMLEIYGVENSGKTSLALYIMAEAQKMGLLTAFIDLEHTLDRNLAKLIGVNTREVLFDQPSSAEEALEKVEALTRSGEVGVIVIDSVAMMVPSAEVEAAFSESQMGLQARLMGKGCRKLVSLAFKTNTTIIWINQIREKLGVFFGNPITTPGGHALKFTCSLRLDVKKGETLKNTNKEIIGHKMEIKIVKNKLSVPFKSCSLPLIYGKGIDKVGDIANIAIQKEIIIKEGNTYSFNGVKLGVGEDNTIAALKKGPTTVLSELMAEIQKKDEIKEE